MPMLHVFEALLRGRAETIHEFLPRSYDFSVRVQGAVNVDPQGGQRAFDQILHAALRIGHRGGLVNAQRFLEQINRLIARAVERLDKLLHPLASLRETVRRHRLELRLELLGGAELGEQVFPEVHRFLLKLNARLQGLLITAHGLVIYLGDGFRRAWRTICRLRRAHDPQRTGVRKCGGCEGRSALPEGLDVRDSIKPWSSELAQKDGPTRGGAAACRLTIAVKSRSSSEPFSSGSGIKCKVILQRNRGICI